MKRTGYLIAFFILLYSCSIKEQEYESFNVSNCIYNHRTTKTNQKYPSVNL